MERILIFGSGGSGKSTLAKQLGDITGYEVLHMDKLYWLPGWEINEPDKFAAALKEFLVNDKWIIDGNYRETIDIRLEQADVVVFLDVSRLKCIFRVICRTIKHWGRSREDITAGCNERLDFKFIKWIWNYPVRNKPAILKRVENCKGNKKIYILKTAQDKARLINEVILHLQCSKFIQA